MFNKEEQRRRAAELSALNLAKGQKPVALPPIQVSKSATQSASAWPFGVVSARGVVMAPPVPKRKEPKVSVKYLEEPFLNEFGQIIQVGAKIIAVRQGYNHSIGICEGIYLGLRRDKTGKVKNVAVTVKCRQRGYFLPDGAEADSNVADATFGYGMIDKRMTLPRKRIYPTL